MLGIVFMAAAGAKGAEVASRGEMSIGIAVASVPDYLGAGTATVRVFPYLSASCRTARHGTFGIDTGAFTLPATARWEFLADDHAGLAAIAGYRDGREESDPRPFGLEFGSGRLLGLGTIDGSFDFGLEGHVAVVGVPLFVQVRWAASAPQGTQIHGGLYIPLDVGERLSVILLPTTMWASGSEMRAFFGVDPAQALRSGFEAFAAAAGMQRAALEAVADWRISGHWHLTADLSFVRLLGDAARSPVVERTSQWSVAAGVTYRLEKGDHP